MRSTLGQPVISTLPVVGPPPAYGARIEVPITRAIASYWVPAVLTDATAETDAYWTVTIESPVAAGEYLLVWMTPDSAEPLEVYEPLFVEAA